MAKEVVTAGGVSPDQETIQQAYVDGVSKIQCSLDCYHNWHSCPGTGNTRDEADCDDEEEETRSRPARSYCPTRLTGAHFIANWDLAGLASITNTLPGQICMNDYVLCVWGQLIHYACVGN